MFRVFFEPVLFTIVILSGLVILLTILSPRFRWGRGKVFLITTLLSLVGFVPSCHLVMDVLDKFRYGEFEYQNYDEVDDFLVERYLPPFATGIQMPEEEFRKFMIGVWKQYKKDFQASSDSWVEYGDFEIEENLKGKLSKRMVTRFAETVGWEQIEGSIIYEGPRRRSHAGATYYHDRKKNVFYHDAGYW
jgi:hypothetical protein